LYKDIMALVNAYKSNRRPSPSEPAWAEEDG